MDIRIAERLLSLEDGASVSWRDHAYTYAGGDPNPLARRVEFLIRRDTALEMLDGGASLLEVSIRLGLSKSCIGAYRTAALNAPIRWPVPRDFSSPPQCREIPPGSRSCIARPAGGCYRMYCDGSRRLGHQRFYRRAIYISRESARRRLGAPCPDCVAAAVAAGEIT